MIIDSYSRTVKGINIWHDMSVYDYKPPHLRRRQFASLIAIFHSEIDSVPCLVSPASPALLIQSGMSFLEAQQLAQPLPPLAKNTKQDASLSSNTSYFKPSLWMQAHSQPIGTLVSGAEEAQMKLHILMPGCGRIIHIFACMHIVMFPSCLHVDVFKWSTGTCTYCPKIWGNNYFALHSKRELTLAEEGENLKIISLLL